MVMGAGVVMASPYSEEVALAREAAVAVSVIDSA